MVLVPPFVATDGGVGLTVGAWRQPAPLRAEIVGADGAATWFALPYARVSSGRAEGEVVTPAGSRLRFTDRLRALGDGFALERTVRVLAVGRGEVAFSTRFAMAAPRIPGFEALLPGVAYRRNAGAPPGARGRPRRARRPRPGGPPPPAARDRHFLRFARFLQRGTARLVDRNGRLGYAYPGLMMDALSLAPPRGHGVAGWLPWLTVAVLEPMARRSTILTIPLGPWSPRSASSRSRSTSRTIIRSSAWRLSRYSVPPG